MYKKAKYLLFQVNRIQLVVGELVMDFLDKNNFLTFFVDSNENHITHRWRSQQQEQTTATSYPTYVKRSSKYKKL